MTDDNSRGRDDDIDVVDRRRRVGTSTDTGPSLPVSADSGQQTTGQSAWLPVHCATLNDGRNDGATTDKTQCR